MGDKNEALMEFSDSLEMGSDRTHLVPSGVQTPNFPACEELTFKEAFLLSPLCKFSPALQWGDAGYSSLFPNSMEMETGQCWLLKPRSLCSRPHP